MINVRTAITISTPVRVASRVTAIWRAPTIQRAIQLLDSATASPEFLINTATAVDHTTTDSPRKVVKIVTVTTGALLITSATCLASAPARRT